MLILKPYQAPSSAVLYGLIYLACFGTDQHLGTRNSSILDRKAATVHCSYSFNHIHCIASQHVVVLMLS